MMRRGIFALVLLAVGTGCLWLGERGAQAIERLLVERVEHGLAVLDIDWARLDADGFRLELHGHAPDAAARDLALETARATAPFAIIIDHTTVSATPPPLREPVLVELMRDGRDLTITGRLHGERMRAELLRRLETAAPQLALRDLTGINAARPAAGWGPELRIAALAVARVPDAYVRVEPGAVRVEGRVQSDAQRTALSEELAALAAETVRLTLGLREPARVAVPFAFAAVKDASGAIRAELCHARDADEAARLEAALARLGVAPGELRCPVALGGPSGAWVDAVEAGLGALEALPEGLFRLEYRSARLETPDGALDAALARARARLAAALPEGYSVAGPTGTAPAATGAAGPAEYRLRARRGPQGVVVRGVVPDGTAERMIATYAEARLGPLEAAVRQADPAAGVPPGWEPAALVALDALGRIAEGEADVVPGRIRLSGKLADPAEAGRIHRQAARDAPEGYAVESAFTVDLPARVDAIPPSPARCARLLNAVVAGRPIAFAPGEAAFEAGSGATLERLSAILGRCDAARIEIGGHTDSRGPEELNRRLSRLRAEAVLDALIARGVPLARLAAHGYGEAEPVASNETEAGRARNRRIDFKAIECRTRQAGC